MVLKRNPPGYFMFSYMKIWPDAYFEFEISKKNSSNAIETRKSKFFIFFISLKILLHFNLWTETHPLLSTGFTNIKEDSRDFAISNFFEQWKICCLNWNFLLKMESLVSIEDGTRHHFVSIDFHHFEIVGIITPTMKIF